MSNDHNMYQAWREFEAFAVPVTEEGEKAMQRRRNQFEAGWNACSANMSETIQKYIDIHDAVVKNTEQEWSSGWSSAIKNVLRIMEIQHEAAKDNHNFWMYAANLIKTELGEKHG